MELTSDGDGEGRVRTRRAPTDDGAPKQLRKVDEGASGDYWGEERGNGSASSYFLGDVGKMDTHIAGRRLAGMTCGAHSQAAVALLLLRALGLRGPRLLRCWAERAPHASWDAGAWAARCAG